MSLLPVGFGGSVAAYDIAKSVRFRSSASAYLSRTPASAGNRRTWTWSGWVKRGAFTAHTFFGAANGANAQTYFGFSNNALEFVEWDGALKTYMTTTVVYRDPSAWLHVVLSYDNPQATSTNRLSLCVNGVKVTTFTNSTYPVQNYDGAVNATMPHAIGREEFADSSYFDGYLSEINFIDGQALDATSFGEFDANGVWVAKKYTGTYGTNGFYLPFNDGTTLTTLCADASGNANNWTASGVSLTAGVNYDWMDDTPTNNFATLNPLAVSASTASISSGNLLATTVVSGGGNAFSTVALPSSGKFYWEITPTNLSGDLLIGVGTLLITSGYFWLNTDGSLGYYSLNGQRYTNSVGTSYGAAYIANDVIGVAADIDAGTVTFYKNGVSQGAITFNAAGLFPVACDGSGSSPASTFAANFGQRPFAYTPPTGFKAISTKNRPTGGSITTSGSFTGNASTDGPFVWLNGNPSTMTINGNAVTFGTHADKTAGGFKVRSSSASYNTAGSNTYSVSVTGKLFGDSSRAPNTAQGNP